MKSVALAKESARASMTMRFGFGYEKKSVNSPSTETARAEFLSHHISGKAGSNVRISVPIHCNQAFKTGMLRHFMKLAGLTESDL